MAKKDIKNKDIERTDAITLRCAKNISEKTTEFSIGRLPPMMVRQMWHCRYGLPICTCYIKKRSMLAELCKHEDDIFIT